MYMYIYIYIYICMCIYIYIYIHRPAETGGLGGCSPSRFLLNSISMIEKIGVEVKNSTKLQN